nr:unnamed protein product [Callosobruchus chinensis]
MKSLHVLENKIDTEVRNDFIQTYVNKQKWSGDISYLKPYEINGVCWKWPPKDNKLYYFNEDIVCTIQEPQQKNNRGHFRYKYDTDCNMINRILALFKKVTNDAAITRKCGLIWRLYLQFVYTYSSSNVCRNVYYAAVEECPWLKCEVMKLKKYRKYALSISKI